MYTQNLVLVNFQLQYRLLAMQNIKILPLQVQRMILMQSHYYHSDSSAVHLYY